MSAPVRPAPPRDVVRIARKLEGAGFETWTVGGAIRDTLAGIPVGDWDLTTRARPGDVRRILRRTVPIGVEHGTVGVLVGRDRMYEVTTFRRDVETDGRHARVAFADRVEDDLARRDFTINAVAWHPLREELLDPFDGAGDLERGVLRTVGDPAERFREDHLRILRAFRFAGRFGLAVHEETWTAARSAVELLRRLSAERIRDELLKVLGVDRRPSVALALYRESGALGVLYPELDALGDDVWRRTLAAVDHLPAGRPLLRLAGLVRPLEPAAAAALLVRLRLSNRDADRVAREAQAAAPPAPSASAADVRRWLASVEAPSRRNVVRLALADACAGGRDPTVVVEGWRRAQEALAADPPLSADDLRIGGRDLIALGLRPGPGFGRILDALLDRVLEDPARNDPETLRALARELAEGAGEEGAGGDGRLPPDGSGG